MRDAFCERNLKPVFALLALLVAVTIVWAAVFEGNRPGRAGRSTDAASSGQRGGPDRAASPERAAERTPGGRAMTKGEKPAPDAVTMATPNGGVQLITRPAAPGQPGGPDRAGARGPSAGLVPPVASARMQLVGAGPRSRHAFNTVSSLVLPSVVSIHATRTSPAGGPGGGTPFDEPFDGVPDKFAGGRAYENVGSGFVIDCRGYVLTNYHVVARAANLLVGVLDGTTKDFPATVVAADPATDLALLKVSGAPALPEARLGDSHSARVGDWVLAFGSPFGLEQTVTQGIISSRRESLVVDGVSYGDMLQTDAPINRGSSGGPLVNLRAEVIGVNTAIYGPSGIFSGTGFAIPADRARAFLARCRHVFNWGRRQGRRP